MTAAIRVGVAGEFWYLVPGRYDFDGRSFSIPVELAKRDELPWKVRRILSFEPTEESGALRVFAGMHREPWDSLLNRFLAAGPNGYHNPEFGNVGIYDPESQLKRVWLNGELDRCLYEMEHP